MNKSSDIRRPLLQFRAVINTIARFLRTKKCGAPVKADNFCGFRLADARQDCLLPFADVHNRYSLVSVPGEEGVL